MMLSWMLLPESFGRKDLVVFDSIQERRKVRINLTEMISTDDVDDVQVLVAVCGSCATEELGCCVAEAKY